LFKPETYDPSKSYPLVLYLHGANDTLSRDITWYHSSVQRENPLFVLTPKCTNPNQGWGNTWTDTHSASATATLQILDSLMGEYSIDKNRLYIYGISMGGFGVFSVLAKEPNKFAAGYAVCGGSNETVAAKLLATPLWIFHGDSDDIVPVRLSRQIYQGIKNSGGKMVRYTEYPGVKHNSWENVAREKSLHRWLLAQNRNNSATSPRSPEELSATTKNSNAVNLTWSNAAAGQNRSGVWYYKLYRDDKLVAEIDGDEVGFVDTTTGKNSSHEYYLVAVNFQFKESKPSATARITLP
jgi:poly(3-hydroxybutyrate) depolymerase